MANAPFGPNMNLTKEEYAKQLAELEEAERKHNEQNEPGLPKLESGIKNSQSQKLEGPPPPYRMVFHDFDYINPETQKPHGNLSIDYQRLRAMAETSTKSFDPIDALKMGSNNKQTFGQSPGKSIYLASERGSEAKNSRKLGGHVTPLRALKGVQPYLKKPNINAMMSTNSVMAQSAARFNSLQPKSLKKESMFPKISNSERHTNKPLVSEGRRLNR